MTVVHTYSQSGAGRQGLILQQGDLTMGDSIFQYCMKQACCAPLEEAATTFSIMGGLLTPTKDVSPTRLQAALIDGLQ